MVATRSWGQTLSEHAVFILLMLPLGPATIIHGLVALFVYARTDSPEHTKEKTDVFRCAVIWISWGVAWAFILKSQHAAAM